MTETNTHRWRTDVRHEEAVDVTPPSRCTLPDCVSDWIQTCLPAAEWPKNKTTTHHVVKGKGFPYLLLSVGAEADPGVQAISPQVTISHAPDGRLPLLSARPAVTFPATQHNCPWPVPSYTAWWQRHMGVNNLPKVVTQLLPRVGFEPTTCWLQVQRSTRCVTAPPTYHVTDIFIRVLELHRMAFLPSRVSL